MGSVNHTGLTQEGEMTQSQEAVKSLYDAFARGDVDAILSVLDEDIDWRAAESLPHGGHFSGRDGVGQFFQGIGEQWENLTVNIDDVVGDGELVVVLATAHGRLRATGEDTGYAAAHAWTLRDGTPVRFHETVDAPRSLSVAGG
jgi:ketosteroid isomerase-like protein